ncbi:MAG TPA: VCBS domain-containing protein, partial [Sphingomicrobium sp.]|nr:VCBS domain-containing protein [Sphingomicrobium sp.]
GETATLTYALTGAAPTGLTFNADGSYSFDASSYDYLTAGEPLVLTIPFTASDATSTSASANLVITVTGTNDVPVANAAVNSVLEDAMISGNVSATDADAGETGTLVYALTGAAPAGLTFNPDGSYSFDAASYDYLTAGEPLVLTIPFAASDATSTSAPANLVITVTGTNDVPVANAAVNSVLEDASISGNVSATDADAGETTTLTYTLTGAPPTGLTFNSDGSYSFDASSYDYLTAGEPLVLTIPFTATDAQAVTSAPANLVITITGTNDVPVANAAVNAVNEDAMISGNVTASDADAGETAILTYALTGAPPTGLTFNADGSYSFDASSYDYLVAGEPLVLTIPFTASDATSTSAPANLVITVTGTNDVPVANAAVNAVNEDASISGNVSATDADAGETATLAYTLVNPAPTGLTFNANGSYTFDASSYDYLAAGEPLVLTIPFTATDAQAATSAPANLVITITGTNDAPDIHLVTTDAAARTLIETNAGLSTSGTLTVNDPDISDVVGSSVTAVVASGTTAGLGLTNGQLLAMFGVTPTSGLPANAADTHNLTWNFNSGSEAFNYLTTNQSLTLTYTITSSDGNGGSDTQNVTVTVNGTNDAPVLTGPTAVLAAGTEDTSYTIYESDLLAGYTDVDGGDLRVSSLTAVNGILTDNLDGTWTFAPVHNFNGTVSLTYSVVDGHGGSVSASNSFTLAPVNDPATFAGADMGAVTEDAAVTVASGQFFAVDPDAGQSSFQPQSGVVGTYGTFGITAAGAWTYTLNNADPDTNGLAAGQVVTEAFTVASFDGTTTAITLTITGTNDAPDIHLVTTDTAAATLTETNAGLLVAGSLTVNDPDTTDVVSSSVTAVVASGTTAGLGLTNGQLLAMLGVSPSSGLPANAADLHNLTWNFDSGSQAFDYLNSGQSLTLTYTVTSSDGNGGSDTQNVSVTINGTADSVAPTANNDAWVLSDLTSLPAGTITAAWFLNNDTDADSPLLFVTNVSGLPVGLTANYDGAGHLIDITGTTPAAGSFVLSYTMTDGTTPKTASVSVSVLDTTSGTDNFTLDGNDFSYIDLLSGGDTMTGDASLTGNAGKDIFVGNNGNDTLSGGAGDDQLFGESNDDVLNGGAGNDLLDGGNNNDTLNGGLGNDILTGGTANDVFVFNTTLGATNIDTITDFDGNGDRIHLDDAIFVGITNVAGSLNTANFVANATGVAGDANDFILYNTTTGDIYYDADGSGAGAKILFAHVTLPLQGGSITNADFLVI